MSDDDTQWEPVNLKLSQDQLAAIAPEEAKVIGELYDSLPPGEWVELPEYGIRVKRYTDETP